MNREIKFRAWDRKGKKLYPFITIYAQDFGHVQVSESGEDKVLERGEYDLMQFTGLKDKNRKEIYEGDLVKIGYEDAILPVEFRAGMFGVEIMEPSTNEDGTEYFERFVGLSDEIVQIKYEPDEKFGVKEALAIEVIGNIYENLELL